MITIKNISQFLGGIDTITDRAAHLIQGMEKCPVDEIIRSLEVFDNANSPDAKSANSKRWLKQYAGFESSKSGKQTIPIIEIVSDGVTVKSAEEFDALLSSLNKNNV